MDPALREILRDESANRVVEAIIRFTRPGVELPGVRVVARFGTVATCRIPLALVPGVWAHPDVVSLKAARPLGPEAAMSAGMPSHARGRIARRPAGEMLSGAGVVVGVVDWGLDVDHANFKHPDGSTRLLALWDQRPHRRRHSGTLDCRSSAPAPYGYGTVFSRDCIDRALRTTRPYHALDYYASDADRGGGAHGTHVMDIAAGNGTLGPVGVAPGADLAFVHLTGGGTSGLANLGDSVRLLEAIDFVVRAAGERPCVINLSMGRHGGPHDGSTLVEVAMDELLSARPGRFIVQSAGNYHEARTHATGAVGPGEHQVLRFVTSPADFTPNELEIWYDQTSELGVSIDPPGGQGATEVRLGDTADVIVDGSAVGRVYHRARDPNGSHHVDAFLSPSAPDGEWRVTLWGRRGTGRFHAWLERDEACARCQARFVRAHASSDHTIGTIANGHLPLVVGAHDARSAARPPSRSSSDGPTRDGRPKPDLVAPGVAVLAARSAPRGSERSPGLGVRKSGSSMAAPHATGAVALCLEHAGHLLGAAEIRRLVLDATDTPTPGQGGRLGRGYLNIPALLAAARRTRPPTSEESAMEIDSIAPFVLDPARVYREHLYHPDGDIGRWVTKQFSVLAGPGEPLVEACEVGDVVIRAVLGHPGARGDCVVVSQPGLVRRQGSVPDEPSGWYVQGSAPVAGTTGGSRAVRVLDPSGLVPPGQLVLRSRLPAADADTWDLLPSHEADEPSDDGGCGCGGGSRELAAIESAEDVPSDDPGPWRGTADQREFRALVMAEHIRRSTKAKGAAQRDLREEELADVPGTCVTEGGRRRCVRTATATAEAAGRLLVAATADLAAAQRRGDPDALRTVRLTATSGYRGRAHQERVWLSHFEDKYYNATRAARAKLPEAHGDAAVDYMLRKRGDGGYGIGGRVAAPGFSNHQGGIAIDYWQERTRGNAIPNDSDDPARCRWRRTWFHGWLRTHAAAFGFRPIPTEEWHWEYRPAAAVATGPTEHRGGRLWTFASAAHPQPVAVFCPKAALGRQDVEVLVFAHGLLGPCKGPKSFPSGLVTDPPFRLGRAVDDSGRPIVLVVPLLDWANTCGGDAFGRAHKRWHPLGSPAVLNVVIDEALKEVGRVQGIAAPALRNLVVAGHSRAYDLLEPLVASRADPAMQQGALARLSQVWAFDTTYGGDVSAWTDWLASNPALQLQVFYRPGGKTSRVGDKFFAARKDRLLVTKVEEGHCAVPAQRLSQLLGRPATSAPLREEDLESGEADDLSEYEDSEMEYADSETEYADSETEYADSEWDVMEEASPSGVDADLSAMFGLESEGQ